MVGVINDGAVIVLVPNAVVICVGIAVVSQAVVVGITLVAVGDGGAVIQRVLDTVPAGRNLNLPLVRTFIKIKDLKKTNDLLVTIDVVVADITHQIVIAVVLIRIGHIGTVVARVAQPILVRILLIGIGRFGTVVTRVDDAVVVQVVIAGVA